MPGQRQPAVGIAFETVSQRLPFERKSGWLKRPRYISDLSPEPRSQRRMAVPPDANTSVRSLVNLSHRRRTIVPSSSVSYRLILRVSMWNSYWRVFHHMRMESHQAFRTEEFYGRIVSSGRLELMECGSTIPKPTRPGGRWRFPPATAELLRAWMESVVGPEPDAFVFGGESASIGHPLKTGSQGDRRPARATAWAWRPRSTLRPL